MNDGITHALSTEQMLLEKICALYAQLDEVHKKIQDQNIPSGSDPDARKRLYIVTRKLPFQLAKKERGWKVETTGEQFLDDLLVNCASAHAQSHSVWMGCVTEEVDPWEQSSIRQQLLKQHRYYPVFLDPHKQALFYDGFCKTTLWPLFHTSPPTTDDVMSAHDAYSDSDDGDDEKWQSYVSANRTFAEMLQDVVKDDDMIWIHGYELMLVPQMLRNLIPHARIGFFLHVPFPTAELYRILPNREQLLQGILSSDLIGFQTYQYARHFFSACECVLGVECSSKGVDYGGHFASVCITSVGINPDRFEALAKSASVRAVMDRWNQKLKGRRMLLGIDKLESTMGLIHKLLAIEDLFADNPQLPRQVAFVQVLVPPKQLSREQHQLESQLHSMAIRINSQLNALDVEGPLQFISQSLPVEEVVALYCMADALVITPLRDGMNVRPFEYVVCRHALGMHAAVVLSEFAGCARSLGGALLVNPWDTNEVKETILQALQLDFQERMRAHDNMVQYVHNFTSLLWQNTFIEQLRECAGEAQRTTARELHVDHVLQAYQESTARLVLLGLEGVLCDRYSLAELISIPPEVIQYIRRLAANPQNAVVIKSSRACSVLDNLFRECLEQVASEGEDDYESENMTLVLAAEDGLFVRNIADNDWYPTYETSSLDSSDWRDHVFDLLEHFTERTPGSVIEEKDMGIAWHYRDSDVVHGAWQARQVQVSLTELGKRVPISVFLGDRVVEVKPRWATYAVTNLLRWLLDHMSQDDHDRPSRTISTRAPILATSATTSPVHSHMELKRKQRAFSFAYGDSPTNEYQRFRADVPSHMSSTGAASRRDRELDFVFILVSGTDSNDEDIFEAVAPRPFDLDDVLALREDTPDSQATYELASAARQVPDTSPSALQLSIPVPLTRSGTLTNETETKESRRLDIKERGQFAPRRDFPPVALLFKAMRKKFGENFSRDELPDTPAACWSLVLSMQDDSNTHTQSLSPGRAQGPSGAETDQELSSFVAAYKASRILDLDSGSRGFLEPDLKLADQRVPQLHKLPGAISNAIINSSTIEDPVALVSPASDPGMSNEQRNTVDLEIEHLALPDGGETFLAPDMASTSRRTSTEAVSANVYMPDVRLPINTFSCAVGIRISQALHYVKNRQLAMSLICSLAEMIIVKIDGAFSTRLHLPASSAPR